MLKQLFYIFCLMTLTLACHSDIFPDNLLYRRWVSLPSNPITFISSPDSYITFLAEGVILYGKDGTDGTCCLPYFFVRQDSIINFKNAPVKPLPVKIKSVDCSVVRCASPGDSWKIVNLTSDQLVLQTPYGRQTYRVD